MHGVVTKSRLLVSRARANAAAWRRLVATPADQSSRCERVLAHVQVDALADGAVVRDDLV
jgi:hypothetical protein